MAFCQVSKYLPQFVKRISEVPNTLKVLSALFSSNATLCGNLSKFLLHKVRDWCDCPHSNEDLGLLSDENCAAEGYLNTFSSA